MIKALHVYRGVVALVVGTVLFFAVRASLPSEVVVCSPTVPQVMAKMASTARPNMGTVEREFWLRVVTESAEREKLPPEVWLSTVITELRLRGQGTSTSGAQGASQVMPGIWKGKIPQCPKDVDLQEIEPNLRCGAGVLAYEVGKDGNIEAALRRYNAGSAGPSVAQGYADATLARIAKARLDLCAVPVVKK